MKKFLAVLLAVAILGVASAAFADASAGHNKFSGDTTVTTKFVVDTSKVAEVALEKVKSIDVKSVSYDKEAVKVTALTETAQKTLVETYAKEEKVVAAALPQMVVSKDTQISADITVDEMFKGKKATLETGAKAKSSAVVAGDTLEPGKAVALSGTSAIASFDAKANTTYSPVVVVAFDEVSDDVAFAGAVVKSKGNKKVNTFVSEAVLKTMTSSFGTTVMSFDVDTVGDAQVTLDEDKLTAAKKAAMGLLPVKSTAKAGTYALFVDVSDLNTSSTKIATLALDLVSGDYVKTSSEAALGFADGDGKKVTSLTGEGYVVFSIAGGKAYNPVLTVEKTGGGSNDPTSSKGSGGCNGGFAGIAVLALGLAALRRKAR